MGLSFKAAVLSGFVFFACIVQLHALTMKGKVYDMASKQPMANVNIVNTYTEMGLTTDSTGVFSLNVEPGHLIEFRRIGYKVVRIRIPSTQLPFYSIAMREGAFDLEEVEIRGNNYKADSIERRETYKWAIEHYELSGLDIIQHPFDALSKKNRQIWAFQKRYEYFEKEKFVDYVFNTRLILKITTLDSASVEEYRRYYRPTYDQVKAWSEYEFLSYIKETAILFQRRRG